MNEIGSIGFIRELAAAQRANGDPGIVVFENYVRWKGPPAQVMRLAADDAADPPISPQFAILVYAQNPLFNTYCTLGASLRPVPGSAAYSGDPRGVRFEYLIHARPEDEQQITDLLPLVAAHPYVHNIGTGPGAVLSIGEPVVRGSAMEYLYLTYPYVDEPHMQTRAYGQIDQGDLLIQMLWLIPLYRSEVAHLEQIGPEAFEELLFARHQERYDAYELDRLPLV